MWRPVLGAAGSGLALALALPGAGWWPLALFFPGLLLWALRTCSCPGKALAVGWLAGIVHWGVATSWVIAVMHDFGGLGMPVSILCLFVMAVYLGFSWAVAASLTVLVRPELRPWFLAAAWMAIEAARQFPFYIFPWNTTASCFSHLPVALLSLPIWGATGLGWAIVATGAGLWACFSRKSRLSGAALTCLALLLVAFFSVLAPAPRPAGDPIEVALVQPGTTLDERWDPSMWREVTDRVNRLSLQAAGADLVLWPEGAVPYVLESDGAFRAQVEELARVLGSQILINSRGSTDKGGFTNSAYLVRAEGVSPARYDKMRLVPFGEYVPGWARIAFTEALVREVASFTPGGKAVLMPGPAPLGVAICYEIIFADLVASQVRAGAAVLTTITNDGWYGFSWAPRQHFAQTMLRAAETRRWIARAALTGISGIVDPYGRVVESMEVGHSGLIRADVVPMTSLTPRVRFGDWWAIVLTVAIVCILAGERMSRKKHEPIDK